MITPLHRDARETSALSPLKLVTAGEEFVGVEDAARVNDDELAAAKDVDGRARLAGDGADEAREPVEEGDAPEVALSQPKGRAADVSIK